MIRKINKIVLFGIAILMAVTFVACGGGGGGGGSTGTLELKLTDKTTNEYEAIYVTIQEVRVIQEGLDDEVDDNWVIIPVPAESSTFNLLELVNRAVQDLGATQLQAGHYNQMRLIIGSDPDETLNLFDQPHEYANYLILKETEEQIQLKVPSGPQTGIKLVSGFDIVASDTTELLLDFDALKSVVKAGNSGNWLLKPTIKVIDTVNNTLSGYVYDNAASIVEDALVSDQVYDADAINAWDQVEVPVSTISVDEVEFSYSMYISLGTHNIVVFIEGYFPACSEVETVPISNDHREDFILDEAGTLWTVSGVISGLVATTEDPEPSAPLSIRQKDIDCDGDGIDNVTVELVEVNIANGGEYSIDLPAGSYQIVAMAEGEDIKVIDFEIVNADIIDQDIIFP